MKKDVKYKIGSDIRKAAYIGSVAWAKNTARHIYGDSGLFIP
jgi:putative hydrolase